MQSSRNFSQDKYLEESILTSYSNKRYLELSFEFYAEISILLEILFLSMTDTAKITVIIFIIVTTDV